MFQQLGAENGFDVDIWDPNINGSPGRQAPAGVSLPTSPFLDLDTLKQYKTIVFDSTVGLNGTSDRQRSSSRTCRRTSAAAAASSRSTARPTRCRTCPGTWTSSVPASPTTAATRAASWSTPSRAATSSWSTPTRAHGDGGDARRASSPSTSSTTRTATRSRWASCTRCVYENEDSLVGQLGYGPGALMNSDKHAMTWCRNFDGGRSFTTMLGHNWQFTTEKWFRSMMLNAVQWTAGPGVRQLRHVQRGQGPAARRSQPERQRRRRRTPVSAALAAARAAFDQDDYERRKSSSRSSSSRRRSSGPISSRSRARS